MNILYDKVGKFCKQFPILYSLAKKVRKKANETFLFKKVVFYVSRFSVMHGFNPIWYTGDQVKFWESEDNSNFEGVHPYLLIEGSTRMMFEEILTVLEKEASFLEIGCNAGRNLQYLLEQGFQNLSGIEINKVAVDVMMKKNFSELYEIGNFYIGDALEQCSRLSGESYDVVFAHSVLIHIPPSRKKLFEEMVRVSRKYIIVLSQENSENCYPYDFKKIFEKSGCKEIFSKAFYSGPKGNFLWGSTNYQLPTELFDENPNFFKTWMLKIFIKKR